MKLWITLKVRALFVAEKAKIIDQLMEEINISSKKEKEVKGLKNYYTGKCAGMIHAIDLTNSLDVIN